MVDFSTPRILLAGVSRGVGKALIGIGLAYELRRRGVGLSCCTLGTNLLQAMVFRRICGRYVRTLDTDVLSHSQNLAGLFQAGVGADLVLILGNNGLYDSKSPGSLTGSDAEFATLTATPTVLVVDSNRFGSSLAALVAGYTGFSQGFSVVGSILNRMDFEVEGGGRKDFFKEHFETCGLAPPIGIVPAIKPLGEVPPRMTSQQKNMTSLPRQFFIQLADLVKEHIDVEQLIQSADTAPTIQIDDYDTTNYQRRVRIAVSDDSCFNVGFQDNLDLLRHYGAELVPFSPLADSELPERIGGVYITGAYLEEYGEELSKNHSMKEAIRDFADKGGIVYSEGAGTAYLSHEVICGANREHRYTGAGIIPATIELSAPDELAVEGTTMESSILGPEDIVIRGINTGECELRERDRIVRAMKVAHKRNPSDLEGFSPGAQIFATLAFLHFGSNPEVAKNLVDAAEVTCPLTAN